MKNLLKMYGCNSDMQYFEKIVARCKTGEIDFALTLFRQLNRKTRKEFVKSICTTWETGLINQHKELFFNEL